MFSSKFDTKLNQLIEPFHLSLNYLYQPLPTLLWFPAGQQTLLCDPPFLLTGHPVLTCSEAKTDSFCKNSIPSPSLLILFPLLFPTPFLYLLEGFVLGSGGGGWELLLSFQDILPHLPHLLALDIKAGLLPCSLWRHHHPMCPTELSSCPVPQ